MNYAIEDLAWAAGFIEGEGTFSITTPRGGRNTQCAVRATQVDKAPLLKLQTLFGGSLHYRKAHGNHQPAWIWSVSISFVREVLPQLIPFMTGVKKKQAKYFVKFAKSLVSQQGVKISERELDRRCAARLTLQSMKLRNDVYRAI